MSLREELKAQREAAFAPKSQDPYAAYRAAEKEVLATLVFFEGCSYNSYKDIVKVDTIGIGNTRRPDGSRVGAHDRIKDNAELMKYVRAHLEAEVYPVLKKTITRDLSKEETAALVSLIYNCGPRVLLDKKTGKPTALAKAINAHDLPKIEKEWMRYNYTKKGADRGLTIRRALELGVMSGKVKPEELLVCTYDSLNLARLYRGGKLDKSESTYRYIKEVCQQKPSLEKMKKFSYFNYGQPVGRFVNGIRGEKNYDLNLIMTALQTRLARH